MELCERAGEEGERLLRAALDRRLLAIFGSQTAKWPAEEPQFAVWRCGDCVVCFLVPDDMSVRAARGWLAVLIQHDHPTRS